MLISWRGRCKRPVKGDSHSPHSCFLTPSSARLHGSVSPLLVCIPVSWGRACTLVCSKLRPSEPFPFLDLGFGSGLSLFSLWVFLLFLQPLLKGHEYLHCPSQQHLLYSWPTPCGPLIKLSPSFLLDPFSNSFINEFSSPKRSLFFFKKKTLSFSYSEDFFP